MSDAPLVYCRPDECSYCIALARNLETALAELAALKGQARTLLEAIFNAEDPEDAEEIVADAFPAGAPAWVLEWYREHPTEEEAARAEEGGRDG